MKQKIASGNISSVADARLSDAYDVSSMWKVIDTAMACTSDVAVRRPTMAAVVVQLRENLALEEAPEGSGINGSTANDAAVVYIWSISKMNLQILPRCVPLHHCLVDEPLVSLYSYTAAGSSLLWFLVNCLSCKGKLWSICVALCSIILYV